jgi:hypothetical protein
MWSGRLLLFFSCQLLILSLAEAEPLFQDVEIHAPTEGAVIRPVEGGIVTIGSTQTIAILPDLQFLPGQFLPSPSQGNGVVLQENVGGNASVGNVDPMPRPPREVPPPPSAPPVLPTTTIDLDEVVELGSGINSTHIKNSGHAAVGTFSSICDLNVQGDFAIEEGAYLYFDVRGTEPGEYDLIREYRQFIMSGTIRIIFRNGYAPKANDIVPLVHFPESLSVAMYNLSPEKFQFANIESSPYIGIWINDNVFGVRFYSDTSFVPEPSAMLLAACGVPFITFRRGLS